MARKLITGGSVLWLIISLGACGGTPPTRVATEPYTILSEQPDATSGTLEVRLRITGPAEQSEVKTIAESVIESRRAAHKDITVRTYSSSASASDTPYAISRLSAGTVTHQFDPKAAETRIKTH